MGGSGRWFKSLISLRKSSTNDHEKGSDQSKRKWKLWGNSSEGVGFGSSMMKGHGGGGASSDKEREAFAAAVAAVVRTPHRGFMVIKQEWAAIRIQTLFRGFLARRALRALRAVVRLQAIFRGRLVRKQAAVTLRCMQALVRVQARVKARNVSKSPQGKAEQKSLKDRRNQADPVKQAERSTVGASPNSRATKPLIPLKHRSLDNKSLFDRWMAAKPWESRSMNDIHFDSPDMTPMSRKDHDLVLPFNSFQQNSLVKARRNGVTTRISTNSLTTSHSTPSSSSAISSECMYDDSPVSTSCTSGSPSLPPSTNTVMVEAKDQERGIGKAGYMNLTASSKAKLKACRCSQKTKRIFLDDCPSRSTRKDFLNGDIRSISGSYPSYNIWKDLYATPLRASYHKRYTMDDK